MQTSVCDPGVRSEAGNTVPKLKTVDEFRKTKQTGSIVHLNQPRPIDVRMRSGEVPAVRMAAGRVRVA